MFTEIPLLTTLQKAAGLLERPEDADLRQQLVRLNDRFTSPALRIAVFGPFNFGKSTLLNALLGDRTLPMDLLPTTGAAIVVKAGDSLKTRITCTDGQEIEAAGTGILEEYAVLNEQRRMRSDVLTVEVLSPHPLLHQGVEFLDLPGTNDRETQDSFVYDHLLQADVVLQILDGRQLMTLLEREQLRDWLLDRGMTTVVFIVNFLNLVEPEDQSQVMNRLRAIATSFRTHLPPGVSNLYRVDALPALRARLKGDGVALQTTGLPELESALQVIITSCQPELANWRSPRLQQYVTPVRAALYTHIKTIEEEICDRQQRHQKKNQILQKAQTLLQQEFYLHVNQLQDWLQPSNLQQIYQTSATLALQQGQFQDWVSTTLKPAWRQHQRAVVAAIHKACDFFRRPRPVDLWVTLPPIPAVPLSDLPPLSAFPDIKPEDLSPVAIATGIGFLLSGPVGAAVMGGASYLFGQTNPSGPSGDTGPQAHVSPPAPEMSQCGEIVTQYLNQVSHLGLEALHQYQAAAQPILQGATAEPPTEVAWQQHQLQLLRSTLAELEAG